MLFRNTSVRFAHVLALLTILALVLSACTAVPVAPQAGAGAAAGAVPAAPGEDKWCKDVTIRFFAGGEAGDAFASIVYKGAQAAEADLGAKVDYVFSGWAIEKMVTQLREAIAAKPDGIAMMGHPGDDAIMPLAEEAANAGILMMYQNVDVPQVRAKYPAGYIGANLDPQGRALSQEAIRTLPLDPAKDHIVVFGAWGDPGRYIREEGSALAFEEAGFQVERIKSPPEAAADPNLLTPIVSAAVLKDPAVKLIVFSGGQTLGAAETYMKAVNKGPGEIYNIGFDTSPAVMDGFEKGYIQLTSDQQPFLQGYLPILSLCLSKTYGMAPITFDTGAGFVDTTNYKDVLDLANQGIR